MPGRRVILHAGFHKTGTTSAQRTLLANGKHIWPRCAMVLPGRLRQGAARMAVRYSRFGTAALLDQFASDLHDTLSSIDPGKTRKVLISEENLAGRMPGRDGQRDYAATPALMARAEDVICDVFGAEADVIFHFTTRAPEDWLRSTYRHNLAASRLTEDWDSYAATHRAASDLAAVTQEVTRSVTGMVLSADLSNLTGPLGPAQPLIDLMELPPHLSRNLAPHPPQNTGPSAGLIPALLDLNRSNLSDEALKAAKTALIESAPNDR